MEIVTEADIASADEAYAFLVQLRSLLRYLEVNSGDMEKGSLRCEPNISVRTAEQAARGELGVKVEVKNLNSLRSVRAAIAYEHQRQSRLLARGREVEQVNMGWDEAKKRTVQQRTKESSDDYRYFPEPESAAPADSSDLGVRAQNGPAWRCHGANSTDTVPSGMFVLRKQNSLPANGHWLNISRKPCRLLALQTGGPPVVGPVDFNRIVGAALPGRAGQDLRRISQVKVTPAKLAGLLTALTDQKVNNNTAKQVLATMFESGEEAAAIIKREGLAMVSDTSVLDKAIQEILAAHPDERQRLQDGEQKLLGFFMGQVMRIMQGKADPRKTRARLQELL